MAVIFEAAPTGSVNTYIAEGNTQILTSNRLGMATIEVMLKADGLEWAPGPHIKAAGPTFLRTAAGTEIKFTIRGGNAQVDLSCLPV